MQRIERRAGEQPFSHTRLIGDDKYPASRLRQSRNGVASARQKLELAPLRHVVRAVAIDNPVAVKKHSEHDVASADAPLTPSSPMCERVMV